MLNYKLQNNLTDMGRDMGGGREDLFGHEAKGSTFYPSALNIDDDTTDQFKTRKKAWEELEREQEESKNNIKNLMRNAKADQGKPYGFNDGAVYNVPQDLITEKRQSDQFHAFKEEPRAQAAKKSSEPLYNRHDYQASQKPSDNVHSRERLVKDKSNEDLTMSNHSKTQKRKWLQEDKGAKVPDQTYGFNPPADNDHFMQPKPQS